MNKTVTMEILKSAIWMERNGKALYESAAEKAASPAVRELFTALAAEEQNHIGVLSEQLKAAANGDNVFLDLPAQPAARDAILTPAVRQEILAAGYEAAVIAAGIELEKRSIEYYEKQAQEGPDQEIRRLFRWLCDWEKGHLQFLAEMDRELREAVWFDNRFWPLD